MGIKRLIQEVRHTDAPMSPSCVVSHMSSLDATSASPVMPESSETSDDLANNLPPTVFSQSNGPNDASATSSVVSVDGADAVVVTAVDAPVSETDENSAGGSCDSTGSAVALNNTDIVSDTSADTAPALASLVTGTDGDRLPVDSIPSLVGSSVTADLEHQGGSGAASDIDATSTLASAAAADRQDLLSTSEEESATLVECGADNVKSDVTVTTGSE